jgi:hypothetical protein
MSFKHFELKDIGKVTIYKKRSNKSLKINVGQDNEIKISLPIWTPYRVGLEFAKKNKAWIKDNLSISEHNFQTNHLIGKTLRLELVQSNSLKNFRSRIKNQTLYIYLPANHSIKSEFVQNKIKTIVKEALRQESHDQIKPRLDLIAEKTKLNYKHLNIKELKRRWGSCDAKGNITINLYLIQLPWDIIDYVLLHELVHTTCMSHDSRFWEKMNLLSSDVKKLKHEIKKYKPIIYNQFDS